MLREERPWFGAARRLRKRSAGSDGLTVDLDGVTLGPDFQLVRRTPEGYRAINREELAALLQAISRKDNPDRLAGHLESIVKALNGKDLARARILGLYFPINELTAPEVTWLRKASAVLKQNFNPDQPRDAHGRWGSGGPASSGKPQAARNRSLPSKAAAEAGHAKEPVSTYATLDDAAKGAAPKAIAAAQKNRDKKHEFAGSIYPVPGGFSFDGPHLVKLNAEDKGDFDPRPDAVSWYHTHREIGAPSGPDKDFQKKFEARGGKPAYIFAVPIEPGETPGIVRFSSRYPGWYEIIQ